MAILTVDVRATSVLSGLRNAHEKRIPYAIANAINTTAKQVQAEERKRVAGQFTVRKKEFVMRQAAIIKPFASAPERRYEARVSVGQKPRLLLSQFEVGGERRPFTPGAKSVATPITGSPARPSPVSSVPEAYFIRKLQLKRVRKRGRPKKGTALADAPIKGLLGTYVVRSIGVFQRLSGRSKLLYAYVRGQRLDRRLRFVDTAERVARATFNLNLTKQIADTFRFAFR